MHSISIHALREEGDGSVCPQNPPDLTISIHALREEGDPFGPPNLCAERISIHALREEGDPRTRVNNQHRKIFLSTPSARRATWVDDIVAFCEEFLSTPSARRATKAPQHRYLFLTKFLSTPSARRATDPRMGRLHDQPISIHALREEGDFVAGFRRLLHSISIHALREEGDPPPPPPAGSICNFYPRPPRGGRLLDY